MDTPDHRRIVATWTPARGPAPEPSELYRIAVRLAGSEAAADRWFAQPTALLDGDTPAERLEAGDTQSIYRLLGGYAQANDTDDDHPTPSTASSAEDALGRDDSVGRDQEDTQEDARDLRRQVLEHDFSSLPATEGGARRVWVVWGCCGERLAPGRLVAIAETREQADALREEAAARLRWARVGRRAVPEWAEVRVADEPVPIGEVIPRHPPGDPHRIEPGDLIPPERPARERWKLGDPGYPTVDDVLELLLDVMSERDAERWLRTPNRAFYRGETPQERLDAGDTHAVWALLGGLGSYE